MAPAGAVTGQPARGSVFTAYTFYRRVTALVCEVGSTIRNVWHMAYGLSLPMSKVSRGTLGLVRGVFGCRRVPYLGF